MENFFCLFIEPVLVILITFIVSGMGVVIDCYATKPAEYNEHQQTTKDGKLCTEWNSFVKSKANFPDASLSEASNFCRAVGKDYLWCRTSDGSDEQCGIEKCEDNSFSNCGTLKIEQPALLGRNVTFIFTPYTYDPNAILEWQRSNKENPWYTRPFTYKFTQYYENGSFYMILTDSVQKDDEVFYRIHYYNENMHCWVETERLKLDDNPNNPCGFVYLRNDQVLKDEDIHLEYYPSTNVIEQPDNYVREWKRSRDGKNSLITPAGDIYREDQTGNGMFVLTFNIAMEYTNGNYGVYCGKEAEYTNYVAVFIQGQVPPSMPALQGLQDIDECKKCIVGSDKENIQVHCSTSGGTQPVTVKVTVKDKPYEALQNDTDISDYVAFITLTEKYHNSTISCSVQNGALSTPLRTTAKIYVIKPPSYISLSVPSEQQEGNQAHITCIISSSRPSPKVYLNISGTDVPSAKVNTTFNLINSLYSNTITLTPIKREWNGMSISCCVYSKWYTTSRKCSEPKQINVLHPPQIEFSVMGSIFNISKGDMAHVKCLADSAPASNISWIEKSDKEEEIIMKQCYNEPACVLEINAVAVSERRFVCVAHYLKQKENKTLIVNVQQSSGEKRQMSDDMEGKEDFMNGTNIGIIFGTCAALFIFIIVIVIVIKKKRNNAQGEYSNKQLNHNRNSLPPRENEHDEPGTNATYADDQLEVTYSKPIKKKKMSVICDETYSEVDKTGRRNQQAAEGQRVEDGQLMYVDLEFSADENVPKEAVTKRRNSPTEYVAIDFAKTASNVGNEKESTEMENIYANQQHI